MKTVATLQTGEIGIIESFEDTRLQVKFLEMGCLPGTEIEMCNIAPFGSPLCIKVCGYYLALRKEEANQIKLVDTSCPVTSALK